MPTPIEPGLLRTFRYFTGIAMLYFALLLVYAFVFAGQGFGLQAQSSLNFLTNLALFGYLSLPWLERRLKGWYLPIALLAATVIPVFSNLIYLAVPPETSLYFQIARSWLLLPILVVPLVLIAWQYPFWAVLLFIVFTTAVELSSLLSGVTQLDMQSLSLVGTPLIRAFAFGTAGHIVQRLIKTQRQQRRELLQANLQLARHSQTLEQLAASRERNRLARELHDTLAHTLSGLAVNLEAIRTVAPEAPAEASAMLEHSLAITRTGLAETRRALKDLRAQPIEDLGLCLAIRSLAEAVAVRANFELEIDLPADLDGLSPAAEQNLYRITQEALENIARHSYARHAALKLENTPQGIILTIQDDGRGLSQEEALEGFGVQGMRERAAEIGAQFSFRSRPGGGTCVHVTLKQAPPVVQMEARL